MDTDLVRFFPVENRWCVHAYYTLCPWAPDGSGRLLLAGADLSEQTGMVYILDSAGKVVDQFGKGKLSAAFYHTGYWQTWSPDARFVYYQSGTPDQPRITRRELESGKEVTLVGDMEGAPPSGEPVLSGLMGMLYAAGYSSGKYEPNLAPAPFQARDQHGLFEYSFDPPTRKLRLSVAEMLERHPERDRLQKADRDGQERLGAEEGLTLMIYCARWAPNGERFLFYFGNHNVVKSRGEPKLAYVFSSDRKMKEIHLVADLSFGKPGVHWGWQPDCEHLMGYGPDPDDPSKMALVSVRYDGSDYHRLSRHHSGGHPNISPADPNLLVTDTSSIPGLVEFIDLRTDQHRRILRLPRVNGDVEPSGRNPFRVCHHPVFSRDGKYLLVNTLPGALAIVGVIEMEKVL
jgi:hypothetical protein